MAVGKHFVLIVLVSAALFLINLKNLCLASREIKEGGKIIVEVNGKVAKIRNLKVSLKLFSFFFPLKN